MAHLHVVVRGRVQGVGFRWFVARQGRTLGLRGRVWNRADGAVEAEAEGALPALEQWLDVLRRGPSGARVVEVRETWGQDEPGFEGFEIVG